MPHQSPKLPTGQQVTADYLHGGGTLPGLTAWALEYAGHDPLSRDVAQLVIAITGAFADVEHDALLAALATKIVADCAGTVAAQAGG